MAQPADYLRLTGPLGGANFLNTSDYARGAQTAMMPVNQVMDVAQQGAQIGQTVAQTRAVNQQTQQRQQAAAQEEAQRKAQLEAMQWAANTMMSASAPQTQAQPAPITQQQTPAPIGAGPVVGVQGSARTAPVAPQSVPQQPAPQQPVMPPTTAQQATQQPVPQSAAAQTVPRAVQPPTLSQRIQNVGGEIQRISQTHDTMMSKLYGDVQAGRISPEAALLVEQGLTNKRNSDADRIIKYEKDLAEIADKYAKSDKSEAETRKARIEAAKATVEFEDSGYYQVKKTFETMGPDMAIAVAASLGLDPATVVTQDGKLSPVVEKRANRSPEAREERKAAAEEAKANAIKWTFDKDLGVSTGVDKDGRVMIRDSEGNTMTSAQFREMQQQGKVKVASAGAPRTVVSTGQVGDVGALKSAIGKNDAASLAATESANSTARGIINQMTEIQSLVVDPRTGRPRTDLPLGPGQGLNMLAQRLGLSEEKISERVVAEAVRMRSAEAELVAAGRMKGQGQITESERAILRRASAGDIANFTPADWAGYTSAQIKLQRATIENNNARIDRIQKRNPSVDLSTYRSVVPAASTESTQQDTSAIDKKWGAK